MARDCLVTLDAGTGSGRCVVYDRDGRPVASAQESFHYKLLVDADVPMIRGFDLDAAAFWAVLCRCARAAMAALPSDAVVRGVIATSQREGCVLLDAAGEVLYAGPNLDARAAMEGMELQGLIAPARLHALTGHAPPYIFPVARWRWFQKHGDAARAASLLMLNDWITFLLSGEKVAEHSNASESMLYDVTRQAWCDEIVDAVDMPHGVLPRLAWAGEAVGRVTAAAAAATGIPAGAPVFAGGADTESALLGSGAVGVGRVGIVLGTTAPVQLVTDRPILDPAGSLWTSSHVVPAQWVLESNGGDSGGTYCWLLDLLYGGTTPAAHAAASAEAAQPGDHPVTCFLGPHVFDLSKMHPFRPAGLLFPFPILHIDRPSRGEIMRGFFENLACAMRGNVEQVRDVSALPLRDVCVSGGLTKSATIVRMLADVLGRPITISDVPETTSLGCAVLAAVGAGVHPSLDAALAAMTRGRVVEPDPTRVAAANERYEKWRTTFAVFESATV